MKVQFPFFKNNVKAEKGDFAWYVLVNQKQQLVVYYSQLGQRNDPWMI